MRNAFCGNHKINAVKAVFYQEKTLIFVFKFIFFRYLKIFLFLFVIFLLDMSLEVQDKTKNGNFISKVMAVIEFFNNRQMAK